MKKSFLILFIIIISSTLYAEKQKAEKLFFFGDSAISLGRAGTGAASSGIDLFDLNPASAAELERTSISIQYGGLINGLYSPNFSLGIPTSYGVLGFSYHKISITDSTDFTRINYFSFGLARDITKNFMFGFSLNFFYGNSNGPSFFNGATIGSIYKIQWVTSSGGFGIFYPRIAASARIGIPYGEKKSDSNLNSAISGYIIPFYKSKNFNCSFFNDISSIDNFKHYPLKFGIEAEINEFFYLRTGFIAPNYYDYGDYTFGTGFRLNTQTFAGSIDYSLVHYRKNSFVHYIGIKGEFGGIDVTPPLIKIAPDRQYISPNGDGINDYVILNISLSDESRIKGWRLHIFDDKNLIVKEYKISDRVVSDDLSISIFFRRLFNKRESVIVPEKILWDGTDRDGKVLPDGKYYYSFTAWDEKDNISNIKTGQIFIDNTPPEIKVKSDDLLFSPNGDKNKDILIIRHEFKTAPDDEWIAGFIDLSGNTIKNYIWTGATLPKEISWDGKDDKGNEAREGLYTYFIKSSDKAGNSAKTEISEISLTRKFETADILLSSSYFSFLKDKSINIFPKISSLKGLEEWKITIFKNPEKPIRTFSGKNDLPKIIEFDCKDDNQEKLYDGEYFLKFTTAFSNGNRPSSFDKKLIIDSEPPNLRISHYPKYFSPDNDGENDSFTIYPSASDNYGIREWRISIYEPSGALFKSFSGKGETPKEIIWDGTGESREPVESASDYSIELYAVDHAGNSSLTIRDKFHVDVLVHQTEKGLKMTISNIDFEFESADLKKASFDVLDRVAAILKKYEKYNVSIECHTDDIGRDDYNLMLSEKRGRSVRDYLSGHGIQNERMKFIGMGETSPVYPNTSDENRRRNRRVEFILTRQSD